MDKPLISFISGALLGAAVSAVAMNEINDGQIMNNRSTQGSATNMKATDTTGVGTSPKVQFMKAREIIYDEMKHMAPSRDGMIKDGAKVNIKQ